VTIYGGDGGDDDYDDGELPKLHMLRPAEIVRQSEMRIYKSGYRGLLQSAFRPLPAETEKYEKLRSIISRILVSRLNIKMLKYMIL